MFICKSEYEELEDRVERLEDFKCETLKYISLLDQKIHTTTEKLQNAVESLAEAEGYEWVDKKTNGHYKKIIRKENK